jgi:hypothetical protein
MSSSTVIDDMTIDDIRDAVAMHRKAPGTNPPAHADYRLTPAERHPVSYQLGRVYYQRGIDFGTVETLAAKIYTTDTARAAFLDGWQDEAHECLCQTDR